MRIRDSLLALGIVVSVFWLLPAYAAGQGSVRTQAASEGTSRYLAGEDLVFSIKLLNFGSQSRVDVIVTYIMANSQGRTLASQQETVAVDTTASFIKHMPIPQGTPAGTYILRASIAYPNQLAPAVTEFQFIVIRQLFGMPVSTFYMMAGAVVGISGAFLAILRWLLRRQRRLAVTENDYSDKPPGQRIYYELLGNAIYHMRLQVGERALEIACSIPDLVVDPQNGKVESIEGNPSKIMELLILRYETLLGQKAAITRFGMHNYKRDEG